MGRTRHGSAAERYAPVAVEDLEIGKEGWGRRMTQIVVPTTEWGPPRGQSSEDPGSYHAGRSHR